MSDLVEYDDGFGTLRIPIQCVTECAGSGDVTGTVMAWATDRRVDWSQTSPARIRDYLRDYGAWTRSELADELDNRARVLWIVSGNIADEGRMTQ